MDPEWLQLLFLRTLEAYYNLETINRALDLLVARGFRLIANAEQEEYENAVPEVTLALRCDIDKYLAERGEELYIHAYSLTGIERNFLLLLAPEDGALYCQANHDYIHYDEEGRAFYQAMLEVFKDLYNSWQPFYGHQDYEGGISLSRKTVIEDQNIGYLYYINLFSPELVNKIGRDRLLSAPAWRIEEFADGGIFLIPVNYMAIDGGGHSLKKVADHLGMNTPQAPGEEWDEYEDEG